MIKKVLLFLLFTTNLCFAGTVTRHTTYATNGQVTATNLNGNFDNILSVVNAGLDNGNANTVGGYRFLEVLGSLPSAGTQGRVAFLTSSNTLNFDTGSAWTQTLTVSGTPAQGDVIYYDGSSWARLVAGTSGQLLKTQGASANPTWVTGGIQSASVSASTDQTTTSTSYVDLSSATITLTTGANPVLVMWTGQIRNSGAGNLTYVGIAVDGTVKYAVRNTNKISAYNDVFALSHLETVTAGSHTFKIQWKTDAGTSTATDAGELIVMELR